MLDCVARRGGRCLAPGRPLEVLRLADMAPRGGLIDGLGACEGRRATRCPGLLRARLTLRRKRHRPGRPGGNRGDRDDAPEVDGSGPGTRAVPSGRARRRLRLVANGALLSRERRSARGASDMQQRRFGRTGLRISTFTLGGGIVGGILIHPADEVRLQALEQALAAGCNWIDTAADYGRGESERAIGRLLPQLSSRPRLSTKVRLDAARLGDLEGEVRRSLETSLRRLGVDRVELFQLHNQLGAETGGLKLGTGVVLGPGGVADVFDKLRGEGHFAWHGITGLGETGAIVEVLQSGRFDTAQVYYNMLNPSAAGSMPEGAMPKGARGQDFSGVLEACRRHDMGVMGIRVLAAGVLATDLRHGREVVVTTDTDLEGEAVLAKQLFARLGDAHGTRAQTAIRFALANPELSTVVVGVATLDQLGEALAGVAQGSLTEEALAEIAAVHGHAH